MPKKKLSRIERSIPTYVNPRSLRDTQSGKFTKPKTKRKRPS